MLHNFRELCRDFQPYFTRPKFTEKDYPDLTGKIYIVTGASSGIGTYMSKLLCSKNAKVYMYGRRESRLNAAIETIKKEYPNANLVGVLVDYNDLATIRPAVDKFLNAESRLDGVMHNAGMNFADSGAVSVQGIEQTLAVNAVAPYLFQKLLDDVLNATADKSEPNSVRIVWVASSAHLLAPRNGGIDWDNLANPAHASLGMGQYGQSKAINVYEAILWSKKHPDSKVISVSVHPGIIKSEIMRNLSNIKQYVIQKFCLDTKWGAYSDLYPLLSPDVTADDNGGHYVPFDKKVSPRADILEAANSEGGEKLYNWLEEQTKSFV